MMQMYVTGHEIARQTKIHLLQKFATPKNIMSLSRILNPLEHRVSRRNLGRARNEISSGAANYSR